MVTNMANTIDTGGGGGAAPPVEFVPLTGGSSITIGGASLRGTTEAEQSGGVNAPTKRTEEGYDYTTRVNREARKASFNGWVLGGELAELRSLRDEKEPFAVAAGHVVMQRAVLDNLTTTAPKDVKGGAYEVEVDVREVFQAQAGTSEVVAFASTGRKGGGFLSGLGDTLPVEATSEGIKSTLIDE